MFPSSTRSVKTLTIFAFFRTRSAGTSFLAAFEHPIYFSSFTVSPFLRLADDVFHALPFSAPDGCCTPTVVFPSGMPKIILARISLTNAVLHTRSSRTEKGHPSSRPPQIFRIQRMASFMLFTYSAI
jgi:hypothetical protein